MIQIRYDENYNYKAGDSVSVSGVILQDDDGNLYVQATSKDFIRQQDLWFFEGELYEPDEDNLPVNGDVVLHEGDIERLETKKGFDNYYYLGRKLVHVKSCQKLIKIK